MITQYTQHWWVVILRGLLAILFGVLAFIWPGISLEVLVLLFGAYALVDGGFAVIAALANNVGAQRWWVLLEGLAGVIAGILTFVWPGLTALVLLYVIAAWAVVTGIFELMTAIELRKVIRDEWLLVVDGSLSIIFGVLIALFPGAGVLSIIWLIALYAVVFGILLLALGVRMRNWNDTTHGGTMTAGRAA